MAVISVLHELERIGWTCEPVSSDEVKVKCPFHGDDKASCTINTEKLLFHCKAGSCGQSGDFATFLARAIGTPRAVIIHDLNTRYGIEQVKTIEPKIVEDAHDAIWAHKPLLRELYERGVTDDDIRFYRIGEARGRITIPIRNEQGTFVNIRRYLPGAPSAEKMMNTRGRGKIRLFPIEQLKYEDVVICGGEMKAIVAARICNPHGVGAITATSGEGNWDQSFTLRLKGKKRAWVMMDIDEAGRKAAEKIAAIVSAVVPWVGVVQLPLDVDKYPTGDVNDFVGRENGDLWPVIVSTPQWVLRTQVADPDEEPMTARLSETSAACNVGRRMRFKGIVAATNQERFVVPKRVVVECDKSAEVCAVCPIFPRDDKVMFVSPESPAILEMINVSKDHLDSAVRNAFGIPRKCDRVTFQINDHYNVEDVRISPSLEISNKDTDRTMQPAICVECAADLNGTFQFVGRMYPHPETQGATLVIANSEATQDALGGYQPRDLDRLRVFNPVAWTLDGLRAKLDDIYADLETNVTRIFMRRDLHLIIDLAYHSPLLVTVDGKETKGWVEVLVVGDSAQGKTEVATNFMRHYKLGEKVDCKNATVAGLLGGCQQMGTKWWISWGVIPTHDRMLVILEELKGAQVNVISRLTDMRSSGVAEIPKIERRRTHARTRLVALSNPRGDRAIASFSFGVEAVRDLIGAPEDIRRFDAALVLASSDVDQAALNALVRDPPKVEHTYTAELCRSLILWTWTRTQKEIVVDDASAQLISESATALTRDFTDSVPLIDRGSTRHKLTRLSAALACRTFSVGASDLQVLVRRCHVEYVVEFLRRSYESRTCGYRYYTESLEKTSTMVDAPVIQNYMSGLQFPEEVRTQILYADGFDLTDVQDWCGYERTEAQQFLSLLVRKRAVRRVGQRYFKSPEFIQFLKNVTLNERPQHIPPTQEKF